MYQSSLEYLRCVRCHSELELESYQEENEVVEGILSCKKCGLVYPVIQKIAILWDDFVSYLSNRPKLGGELLVATKNAHLKSMIRSALAKAGKSQDLSIIEKRWTGIYRNNAKSRFYGKIKKNHPKCRPCNRTWLLYWYDD